MQGSATQEQDGMARAGATILEAALPHVAFDGWSDATFRAAIADSGQPPALARALYPRGGLDLALAFHRAGDARMTERMEAADLTGMRYSDKVAFAIRTRLEVIDDPETVRRGMTLFALPHHAGEGARALWGTADAIWQALGDTSRDLNWYSKRATLSAVYGASVLYWLGDDSAGHAATAEFIDRRIADVMRIEKLKAGLRDNPLARMMRARPGTRADEPASPEPEAPRSETPNPTAALPGRWR